MDDGAGDWAESGTQGIGQIAHAPPGLVHLPLQGVVDGHAQADARGRAAFPTLEAARVGTHFVAIGRGPLGGVKIEYGRLQSVEHGTAHIEESGAAWTTQVFTARG